MNIKIPKFEEFEDSLNEMAFKNPKTRKPYQEGDVVRAIKIDKWTTGIYDYYPSGLAIK